MSVEKTIEARPVEGLHRLEEQVIPHSILALLPYSLAVEYFALPCGVDEKGRIEMYVAYPHDSQTLQRIQLCVGKTILPRQLPKETLMRLIARHYTPVNHQPKNSDAPAAIHHIENGRLSYNRTLATTVLVDDIIHEAIRLRASDIHFEPFEREMCIRFRIDGVLQEMLAVPQERVAEIASRLKIMASMDIAEKRRSQDGRIRINRHGHDVDVRVSTLPTDFGEKLVLRLLDKSSFDFNLESIGMEPRQLVPFRSSIRMPNGIVLLTGPTGSGKSTSLYGIINYLKKPGINISTVEDPIEYNIAGVNQTQVNTLTGMTFANTLRTLLRQDPDIIMLGEMRDRETAEIAVRSSLTGHLVLSTLHTNDAPAAVTRLVDMGIEPYLVASSVTMIVAQRLVRRICDHCKCEDDLSDSIKENIGLTPNTTVYKGLGCSACGFTGYRGRTGIFEVLPVTDEIRGLIKEKPDASLIRDAALQAGMISLRDHALVKLRDGVTSFEEVRREIAVLT